MHSINVTFGDMYTDSSEDEETESESELSSGCSESESSYSSSCSYESVSDTDENPRSSSTSDRLLSSVSDSDSVPNSSSTTTEATESESGSKSDSGRTTNKLSELAEFHTPLYDGADLTILDSYLMMYQFALRHCITDTAFSELISLVDTHVPKDAMSATSLYKLRKFFEFNFNNLGSQLFSYCAKCHRLLEGSDSESEGCPSGCRHNKFMSLSNPN